MKVNVECPAITRISYHQEKADPEYGSCLWAYFDFDTENWMLSIQSDCGSYAYSWPAGKGETFLELCARMHSDYLLNKLCKKTQVDTDLTIEAARECLQEMGLDQEKVESAMEELEMLFDDVNCEESIPLARYLLEEWNGDNELEIDEAWNLAATDYEPCQLRIIKIFEEHIQPKIREMVKREDDGDLNFPE